MGLGDNRRWEWLWRNRQPVDRVRRVGELTARWLGPDRVRAAGRLARLLGVVGERVDREFREHCTLGSLSGGVLTILVDDECLVSALRLRWLLVLREVLAKQDRGFRVVDIRFAAGRGDLTFPASSGQSVQEEVSGDEVYGRAEERI